MLCLPWPWFYLVVLEQHIIVTNRHQNIIRICCGHAFNLPTYLVNPSFLPEIRLRAAPFTKDKKFWKELIADIPCYDTGHIENYVSNNSSIVACIRYRGNVSTEPLPTNDKGISTNPWPSNNGGGGGEKQTHGQRDLISLLIFFQNK
jgi:hypothetical protein